MSEELKISAISARGELHRVTRTMKRYLKWQQASGAIGSVPAPAAEREAFEAAQKAREKVKLDKLKAGLRGPQPSAPARPSAPRSASPPPSAPLSAAPPGPTSSAPSNTPPGATPAGNPSPTSRFAAAPVSANQPPPDIHGGSTSAPWKTSGSRPARRFHNNPGTESSTSSAPVPTPTPERTAPVKSAPQRSTPTKSAPQNATPQKATSQKTTPRKSAAPPQGAPAAEEDIYLMDYGEEMEIPSDYHPGQELYDAPPSANKPPPAAAKDPGTMSKPEKLEFLRNYMGDCRRCGLCEGRQNVVFGAGNPDARLVFVADAPDAVDDRAGTPFAQASVAGTSDDLLAKMVGAMGLSLEDVYLCTVVKCRPPGGRRARPDEVKQCQPFLFKQLEVIEPEVIVALGGFATMAMSAENPSLKPARGQWQTWRKTPLMPTYHPRELLASEGRKQAELKGATWQDLQSVMAKLGLK